MTWLNLTALAGLLLKGSFMKSSRGDAAARRRTGGDKPQRGTRRREAAVSDIEEVTMRVVQVFLVMPAVSVTLNCGGGGGGGSTAPVTSVSPGFGI
jgi:hypothetical protein